MLSRSIILPLVALLILGAAPGTRAVAQPLSAEAPHEVRVRLFEEHAPRAVAVRAQRGVLALFASDDENALLRVPAGETVTISRRGDELHAETSAGGLFARSLRLVPEENAVWRLAVTDGTAPSEPRRYTGLLAVAPDPARPEEVRLVNTVGLEDYVAGVVASEYGFDDLEGAKAVAVAVRTYTVRSAGKYGSGYDYVDHTGSQMYEGLEAITPTARRAAQETRGQILAYAGRPIEAVYFSSSGGHTANNEDVWDATEALPYLRGKSDPYDSASPHQSWRVAVSRPELLRRLSARHGFEVRGFQIGTRSRDGRVKQVELLGRGGRKERVQANAFRLFVNEQTRGSGLRSTFFDAERAGDRYVFEGKGFGHGVGLSQYGAHEMARRGRSYRDILAFYYTGTRLETLDGLEAAPSLTPPVARKEAPDDGQPKRRIGW